MKINNPDSITIQQYLDGTLDPKLMNALEKQALEDPFLAEALEGYSQNLHSGHDLSILQRQLHERIMLLQENKKVYDFTWQRLSVAAAAAVLFISAGILFWMNFQKHELTTASNTKEVEANLTPLDSINTLRNLSSKDKEVVAKLNKSVSNATISAAPDNKVPGYKRKNYTVQLPPKKQTASRIYSKTDSGFLAVTEPALRANEPMNDASENDVSNALKGRVSGVTVTKSKEKSVSLNEVVVTGYSTQRKKDITGSVATITSVPLTIGNRISGKIVDKKGGEPLPGVAIMDKLTKKSTTTDANGNFALNVDSVGSLVIAYIGYNTAEVKARAGQELSIALDENQSALNEVVVTGYGTSKKADYDDVTEQTISNAQPNIGWRAYSKYLEVTVKHPKVQAFKDGKVKLSFDVNEAGELSNFTILKGLSDTYDQEAIAIVKQGPKWSSNGKSISKGYVTINFKKP